MGGSLYGHTIPKLEDQKDSLNQLLSNAQLLAKEKAYDDALSFYTKALPLAVEMKNDSIVRIIYKEKGKLYYRLKEYQKSKDSFQKVLSKKEVSEITAGIHFNLALVFRKEKNIDSLLFHLHKSVQVFEQLENSEVKFDIYFRAGILFKNNGNYETAINYLLKAYKGFEQLNNNERVAAVSNTIASIHRMLNRLDLAKGYYVKVLGVRKRLGDSIKLSQAHNNLANLYKQQNILDSAIFHYSQAIGIQKNFKYSRELGKYHHNLGSVYLLKEKLQLAREHYTTALALKHQEKDSLSFLFTYNELALVALKEKQWQVAKNHLDLAKQSLSTSNAQEARLRYYEIQSLYYEAIGTYKAALDFQKKYQQLYKKLFEEKSQATVQELQERFESKQKEEKIISLTESNTLQRGTIKAQSQAIGLRNILLIMGIAAGFAFYFLFKQKQKLKLKELEVDRLKSVFDGQEVLKEKISRDLHDIISSGFNSIRLKIATLAKAKQPKQLEKKIIDEMKTVNDQIRLISHRLSPLGDQIKSNTLREIIEDQLTEFQYYREIFVDIQLPLPKVFDRLSLTAQTNLYGILLEVLTNIEKHAQATEIQIKHRIEKGVCTLIISDNGIGLSKKNGNGIGILNCKQRTAVLNGRYQIHDSSMGTTVQIDFPVKENMDTAKDDL